MNQLNFIHQRFVTLLFHSDSIYSKRTISEHSVARLAPGRHLTLITAHAQKVCAACVTVTTTPRKCNRELFRAIWGATQDYPIVIQYKHRWHWARLQLERLSWATFVMFRLWFSQGHSRSTYSLMQYATGGRAKSEKAMEYERCYFLHEETYPCLH